MSGTVRAGVVFGIAAVVIFVAGLLLPLPFINILLAFGSMLVLGWGAGYTAAKTAPAGTERGIGRGATAGAIAGVVVLLLSTIALGLVANTEVFRQALRDAMEQTPNINEPGLNPVTAANLAGAGSGFCLGLINLILLVIGGVVGGLMWRGVPSAATTDTVRSSSDR